MAVDPSQNRLVSGSADANLQVYEIVTQEAGDSGGAEAGQRDTLKALGRAHRQKPLYTCPQLRRPTAFEPVASVSTEYPMLALHKPTGMCTHSGAGGAGSVRRPSSDRVTRLCYSDSGAVLACQTTGKTLDFFK